MPQGETIISSYTNRYFNPNCIKFLEKDIKEEICAFDHYDTSTYKTNFYLPYSCISNDNLLTPTCEEISQNGFSSHILVCVCLETLNEEIEWFQSLTATQSYVYRITSHLYTRDSLIPVRENLTNSEALEEGYASITYLLYKPFVEKFLLISYNEYLAALNHFIEVDMIKVTDYTQRWINRNLT